MLYSIYFCIGLLYMFTLEWIGTKSLNTPVEFTLPERILISCLWPVFIINTIIRIFNKK
jgi:hypothetical protein